MRLEPSSGLGASGAQLLRAGRRLQRQALLDAVVSTLSVSFAIAAACLVLRLANGPSEGTLLWLLWGGGTVVTAAVVLGEMRRDDLVGVAGSIDRRAHLEDLVSSTVQLVDDPNVATPWRNLLITRAQRALDRIDVRALYPYHEPQHLRAAGVLGLALPILFVLPQWIPSPAPQDRDRPSLRLHDAPGVPEIAVAGLEEDAPPLTVLKIKEPLEATQRRDPAQSRFDDLSEEAENADSDDLAATEAAEDGEAGSAESGESLEAGEQSPEESAGSERFEELESEPGEEADGEATEGQESADGSAPAEDATAAEGAEGEAGDQGTPQAGQADAQGADAAQAGQPNGEGADAAAAAAAESPLDAAAPADAMGMPAAGAPGAGGEPVDPLGIATSLEVQLKMALLESAEVLEGTEKLETTSASTYREAGARARATPPAPARAQDDAPPHSPKIIPPELRVAIMRYLEALADQDEP